MSLTVSLSVSVYCIQFILILSHDITLNKFSDKTGGFYPMKVQPTPPVLFSIVVLLCVLNLCLL